MRARRAALESANELDAVKRDCQSRQEAVGRGIGRPVFVLGLSRRALFPTRPPTVVPTCSGAGVMALADGDAHHPGPVRVAWQAPCRPCVVQPAWSRTSSRDSVAARRRSFSSHRVLAVGRRVADARPAASGARAARNAPAHGRLRRALRALPVSPQESVALRASSLRSRPPGRPSLLPAARCARERRSRLGERQHGPRAGARPPRFDRIFRSYPKWAVCRGPCKPSTGR